MLLKVVVIDSLNQIAKDSINIVILQSPVVYAGIDQQICRGDTAVLTATGICNGCTYTWYGSPYSNIQNWNPIKVAPTVTTTYTIMVANQNGCQNSDNVVVSVKGTGLFSSTNKICINDTITIGSSMQNVSYLWNNGAQTATISVSPTTTTTYLLTASNAINGCTETIDHIVKVETQLPQLVICPDQTVCPLRPTTVSVFSTNSDTYKWSNNNFGSVIGVYPSQTTTYSVTATNACGNAYDYCIVQVDTSCNLISGNVYFDINNNSIYDVGDLPAAYNTISISSQYTNTSNTGHFNYYMPDGTYTITPILYNGNLLNSSFIPSNYSVTVNNSQNLSSISNNFLLTPVFSDLKTYLTNTVSRIGFNFNVSLTFASWGLPSKGSIKYVHPENFQLLSSSIQPDSTINDTLYFNFGEINQYGSGISFSYYIPTSITAGYTTYAYSKIYGGTGVDNILNNNEYLLPITAVASYDPNDKKSIPEKYYTPEMLANNDSIIYTIRFQNTGTDTAINIRVTDTLSEKLDITTFEMLGASHPYSYTIKGKGIVEWKFLNIMLTDSTTNEEKSHGVISYRIKPKSTFALRDSIENTAQIFFDFNSPVATNKSVIYQQSEVSSISHFKNQQSFLLYPNPANSIMYIECKNNGEYQILDITGKLLQKGEITNNKTEIQIESLAKGTYILQVIDSNGKNYKLFSKK
ncbi:MAG: T9SS type A sorting domain-containing protein [Bacteroidota bacterium]